MKRLFQLFVLLLISSHLHVSALDFVDAKLNENNNRTQSLHTSFGGMEGWAFASYVVDIEGKPKDIVITDYSGESRYIKQTKKYIERLSYSPATLNGVPSVSHKTLFLLHTIGGPYNENSVTPSFAEEYQVAINKLSSKNKNLEEIRELIDDLKDDHTKNLNEHALAAWLESIYYFSKKDFLEYMRQSKITLELHQYMPAKLLAKSSVNLFEAQLHYGYIKGAMNTVNKMQQVDGLNIKDSVAEEFSDKITNKVTNGQLTKVTGKTSELGSWIYETNLSSFELVNTVGDVDSIELRCLGLHKTLSQNLDKPILIPKRAKRCSVLIKGTPNSNIEIIESQKEPN